MIIDTNNTFPVSNSQYKRNRKKLLNKRKLIFCKDTREVSTSYRKYLTTNHWLNIRKQKLESCPVCEKCNSTENLSVGRNNYLSLGKEKLTDLITLCKKCRIKLFKKRRSINKKRIRSITKRYLVGNKVTRLTPYELIKLIKKNKKNGRYVPIISLQPNQINSLKCKTLEG